MPASAVSVFHYVRQYDMMYGEHFYDLTWNNGILHEKLLSDIEVPCIYLHAKEEQADNGIYLCAATREQAERAVSQSNGAGGCAHTLGSHPSGLPSG